MEDKVEMGTISARVQICIPNSIRKEMGLKEGNKVLFFLSDDSLLMKRVNTQSFAEITKPLKDAKKKIREDEVVDLIHKIRREKRSKK